MAQRRRAAIQEPRSPVGGSPGGPLDPKALKRLQGRLNRQKGRAEEDACAELLALAGFTVWLLRDHGQVKGRTGRRYATNSPGVPDIFAVHRGARLALFWDAKAGDARLTHDQRDFAEAVTAIDSARLVVGAGDSIRLRDMLVEDRVVKVWNDAIQRCFPDVGRVVRRRRK